MGNCLKCGFETINRKFCSRSCSNSYNNAVSPKRKLEGRCKTCGEPTYKNWKRCPSCRVPRKSTDKVCPICQTKFKGTRKYCSKPCVPVGKNEYTTHFHNQVYSKYIQRWKEGLEDGTKGSIGQVSSHVRRYIFEKFGSKCCVCGWCKTNQTTGKIPLHLDHINGNWKDNTEDNLRLLCPNCHALTSNYGSLNRGNGRPDRRVTSGG